MSSAGAMLIDPWRWAATRGPNAPPVVGADAWWAAARGTWARYRLHASRLMSRAEAIAERERETKGWSERELTAGLEESREAVRRGRANADVLARALALIAEAAFRSMGLRPYPVQLAAALAAAQRAGGRGSAGVLVELATGEGKTLVAALLGVLEGWRGRGCHLITANDYLARRDAEWMAPLYARCGVRVAWIAGPSGERERRAAYAADVTVCTAREAAADWLRDRLMLGGCGSPAAARLLVRTGRLRAEGPLQRGLVSAIVDEADAVLIDDAAMPLILSGPAPLGEEAREARSWARATVAAFREGNEYTLDRASREARLTARGREALRQDLSKRAPAWSSPLRREEWAMQALEAEQFFSRDAQYIVQDGRVTIVDESTGRAAPDRRWRAGLHSAIEAKEGLDARGEPETLASISFQRFFRSYAKLTGMSGTLTDDATELWRVYGCSVAALPPHRPLQRRVRPTEVFATVAAKRVRLVEIVRGAAASRRPVLVSVRTVLGCLEVSESLARAGLDHELLHAQREEHEAAIIARAGDAGRITVASPMAGRGTDIRLDEEARRAGGLLVVAAELIDSARLERQLYGRAARQGDPGEALTLSSLEDDAVTRWGSPGWIRTARRFSREGSGLPQVWCGPVIRSVRERAAAQARAGRIGVLQRDDWLESALPFSRD